MQLASEQIYVNGASKWVLLTDIISSSISTRLKDVIILSTKCYAQQNFHISLTPTPFASIDPLLAGEDRAGRS